MRVAEVARFGGPEVLRIQKAPDPIAGRGEVVIEVVAADVLWVETMIRRGGGGEYFDVTPPYVPGNGVSGRVRSVGDGVDREWIGRAVVAHTGERGAYAEQVAVPVEKLAAVPDGVGATGGGCAVARRNHRTDALRAQRDRHWGCGAGGWREWRAGNHVRSARTCASRPGRRGRP